MATKPFLGFLGVLEETKIDATAAEWLAKVDIEVVRGLRDPAGLVVSAPGEEIEATHTVGNQMLEYVAS